MVTYLGSQVKDLEMYYVSVRHWYNMETDVVKKTAIK